MIWMLWTVSLACERAKVVGIYQCGLVQERIANDILSLARVQLDTLTLHHATTNLRASARQVGRVQDFTDGRQSLHSHPRLVRNRSSSVWNLASRYRNLG